MVKFKPRLLERDSYFTKVYRQKL